MPLFFREIGSGPQMIILHGLFGSSDNWLTVAKALADDFHIILPDLRNHGQSFHDNAFDHQSMSQDLLNLMKEQNITDPVILGHSLGGKVAMTFAVNNPSMVKKLIVVDIGPQAYPVHHDKILAGLNKIDLDKVQSRKDADEQLSDHVKELGIRQFLLKNLSRNGEGNFRWKLNLPVITKEIQKVGEQLFPGDGFSKPSLFIRGAMSDYISDSNAELIGEIFTDNHLVTIEGAGHWVHAEKPLEFIAALKLFLKV